MSDDLRQAPVLTSLLREVSRSFYLTLRVLPKGLREPIGLAYLLARATDTVADTALVPWRDRIAALSALRDRVLGTVGSPLDFTSLANAQDGKSSEAERILLLRINEALTALTRQSAFDLGCIRDVLQVIAGGQALDLERFGAVERGEIKSLEAAAELEDYTYRVAGCVGEFWTRMTLRHAFPRAALEEAAFIEAGIRFGKGLQMVNILRDLPRDLASGRCYIPREGLTAAGLLPSDLIRPDSEGRFRPIYESLLDLTEAHLDAGWNYTCAIPRGMTRLRLACAWPLLIGIRTTGLLRQSPALKPESRVKIPRSEVYRIMGRTLIRLPVETWWMRLFADARGAGAKLTI